MRRLSKTDANLNNDRVQGMRVLRRAVPYLWPDGQAWVKRRVVIALTVLLAAKLIAVVTPIFYKQAVDALSTDGSPATFLALGAVGLTLAYGETRESW